MSADIYAALHDALHSAQDWKATPQEIDLIRTGIHHRERLDALSEQDRKALLVIAQEYKSRAQLPSYHKKRNKTPATPRQDIDLNQLSFLLDPAAPTSGNTKT